MNPSVSQYKNCWKWGYLALSCYSHIFRYTKYYRAHITKHHREKVWYCIENKKANHLATLEEELYPHVFKCMNCNRDYQADSYNCPY